MQALLSRSSSSRAPRSSWLLLCAALCAPSPGCGASTSSHEAGSTAASPSSGAERPTAREESDAAGATDATVEGVAGEGEPPSPSTTEASRSEDDPYESLLQATSDYTVVLSQSSVDCHEARGLVERICYLAERVCALPGVAAREDEAEAQCDEGRARCSRSETRLRSACPGSR